MFCYRTTDALKTERPTEKPKSGIQADEVEDMRSLGMVYCRQGAYEDAEKMYRRLVTPENYTIIECMYVCMYVISS